MAKGKHESPSKARLAREYRQAENCDYASERRSPRRRGRNLLPLLAALTLIAGMAVGGTVAYLTDSGVLMDETYVAARVECDVQADNCVRNTGNIPAYIRVLLVQNYVRSDGTVCTGHEPVSLPAADGWTVIDGYYYYNVSVAPGDVSSPVTGFNKEAAEDGCMPQLQIIASAIQTQPADAVREAWGVSPAN